MRNSEPVELTLHLHAETDKAWRVSDSGDDEKAVWLPKSHAERVRRVGKRGGDVYLFEVAEWLAEKENLL